MPVQCVTHTIPERVGAEPREASIRVGNGLNSINLLLTSYGMPLIGMGDKIAMKEWPSLRRPSRTRAKVNNKPHQPKESADGRIMQMFRP
jgi:hypothetical protein